MSSTNWAAPNIRVFIANLIEHCHANAETMGSNPAENFFIGLICNYIFVEKKIGWMFVQIDYPSFTLLFVKLTEENEFGIVKVIYL